MPQTICFTISKNNVIELHSSSTPFNLLQLKPLNQTFYGVNLDFIWSTAFSLNPNAFSNTTSLIPDPNSAAACACTPGFWLFRAAMAMAWPSPTLSSKCRRPLGNTNTSPVFTVVANSWLLVLTNPTNKEPSTTNKISVARGCVWGGTRPP